MSIDDELEGKKNDFQLWLINTENGFIKNKRTGMYLTTDSEGNVMTTDYLKNHFNKWKILLPNETFTSSSKIINTPFGKLEVTENSISS